MKGNLDIIRIEIDTKTVIVFKRPYVIFTFLPKFDSEFETDTIEDGKFEMSFEMDMEEETFELIQVTNTHFF